MSLPPVEKLPLLQRKNLQDQFEDKKEKLEKNLSTALLGQTWTIEHDPLALYAFASDDYSKQSPGGWAHEFYAIATRRIDECDEFTKKAINDIASSHVMTLEGKPDADFTYSSCEFRDGKLVLVFNPKNVSNNIGRAAEEEEILPALNLADQSSPISFMARRNIIDTYDRQIDAKKAAIERILGKPVTLTPNFEENFIKLKPVMDAMDNRWDHSFGNFTFQYFHGVERQLEWQKFEGDDLLQGGFFEVVSDAEIVFQVVDKLEDLNRSYNEIVSRDGKLYLQTVPSQWGVNSSDTADLLIGKL